MIKQAIVLASGSKTGGGSGLRKLRERFGMHHPDIQIVGVVSNHEYGGVAQFARARNIPFRYIPNSELTPETYNAIPSMFGAPRAYMLCSGWLRFVHTKVDGKWGSILNKIDRNLPGLDPERTINIHPGLLSKLNGRFGGKGMYGHHVHEAVRDALERGELDEPAPAHANTPTDDRDRYDKLLVQSPSRSVVAYSGFTMHFVYGANGPADYDRGPVFAEVRVPIERGMSADEIGARVNQAEHRWQPLLSEMVIRGQIRLRHGKVLVPYGYGLLPRVIDPRWL